MTDWTLAASMSVDVLLGEQHVLLDDDLAGLGVDDILGRGAAEDALTERGHDLAGIDDRLHGEAARRCRNRAR